jgi:hypothetical protein
MRLEDIQVAVRPRTPWEAMDLGIAMVRRWWRAVLLPWVALVWTLALVLCLVVPDAYLWAVSLVIWYLKPLYDRCVLYVLSRALFGDTPRPEQTLRALPQWAFTGLGAALTVGRLDPARSFNLPVWQLEGLRGKARRRRLSALHSRAHSHAVGFTLIWLHLEVLVLISLQGFIALMIPPEAEVDLMTALFEQREVWHHYLAIALYVLTLTIMEPLYTAGGFGLYLSRRTDLEGWDIELALRRLGSGPRRSAGSLAGLRALALAGLSALMLGVAPDGEAQLSRDPAGYKALIEEVLADEAFDEEQTIEVWLPKDRDEGEEQTEQEAPAWLAALGRALAYVAELLLWLGAAALLLIVFLNRERLMAAWRGLSRDHQAQRSTPKTAFGLDITPESLPEDIAGSAWRRWQAGQHREALSLLYRGTLAALVHDHAVDIPEGATEGELLRDCRGRLAPGPFELLARLTESWQRIAYAHRRPEDAQVEALCREWPRCFGAPAPESAP